MDHFKNIKELIKKLEERSGHKYEKLRLLKIILNLPSYRATLTRTLRNEKNIELQFKQEPNISSSYKTVAGEFLLQYMTDEYEDSLYALNREQKQELIQEINTILEN